MIDEVSTASRRCRLLLAAAALILCGAALPGCTIQRIGNDTAATLEWLRFKHGAEIHTPSRWQLPRSTSILVVEVDPAPDPAWLAAAQEGVNGVFAAPPALEANFHLLVSWPIAEGNRAEARRVSLWEKVDMGRFLPAFQSPFALQVALVRSADGVLVEAAELEVSPRWLSGRSAGPDLVRHAFHDFAASFRPAY